MNRSRGGVYRIIHERQRAHLGRAGITGDRRYNTQGALRHVSFHVGQVLLRHGEIHIDRTHFIDHYDRKVRDLYQIAGLDHQHARAPVNGRINRAVFQVEFGRFDGGFVGIDHRVGGIGGALKGVHLLARGNTGVEQLLIPLRLGTVVRRHGFVAGQLGFGLRQRRLIGSRVDRKEQLAFFDGITLL